MPAQEINLVTFSQSFKAFKKHIFIITFLFAVFGVALAFIIKPKYEAVTTFYPPASNSMSKSILADNNLEGLMEFGNENQTDQMLQLLYSEQLKERLIRRFSLRKHYDIDSTAKYAMYKTKKELDDNLNFVRTDYLAVRISVLDESPILATEMANYISLSLDSMRATLLQTRAKEAFEVIQNQYIKKRKQVDSLLNNLKILRSKGIFDYYTQSEILKHAMVKAETNYKEETARVKVYDRYTNDLPDTTVIRAKGRLAAAKAAYESLQPDIANFKALGGEYLDNQRRLDKENEAVGNLQIKYENAEVDFKKTIAQKFVIDKAEIPERKAYPNRPLVVILSAICGFIISMLLAFYLHINGKSI